MLLPSGCTGASAACPPCGAQRPGDRTEAGVSGWGALLWVEVAVAVLVHRGKGDKGGP